MSLDPGLSRALTGAAVLLVFLAPGLGLLELSPSLSRRPWPVRLAIGYLLGLAVLPFLLFALSHLFRVPLGRPAALAAALAPLLVAAAARRRGGPPRRRLRDAARAASRPARAALLVAAALAGLAGAGLLAESVTNPVLDWDGRMTWFAHARWIRGAHDVNAAALREERYFVMHPRYPPGLPLAQVAAQEALALPDDERLVRPIYAATFLAFVTVLLDGAGRRAGAFPAAAVAALASVTPALTFLSHGGPAGGYSDFPLSALWGTGLLLLLERHRPLPQAALAGALLAGGVLAKNEGLPLAACALAGLLPAAARAPGRRTRPASFLAAALPVLLAAALLSSWRAGVADRLDEGYALPSGPGQLLERLGSRLPAILTLILSEMRPSGAWGLTAPAAAVVLLLGWRGLGRPTSRPLLLPVALASLVYLTAYAVTPWELAELVRTTWSRFLTQLALPVLVLVAAAFGECRRSGSGDPDAAAAVVAAAAVGAAARRETRRPRLTRRS